MFAKYSVSPEDRILVPGMESLGPVLGEFSMYLGFAGSWDQPPEDPHVESWDFRFQDGAPVPDLEDEALDKMDAILWALAEKLWALEEESRKADAEAYAEAYKNDLWEEIPF